MQSILQIVAWFSSSFVALASNDHDAPIVDLHFPIDGSIADGIAISVTGSAIDETGVASIRVNGVNASSSDGFAHWKARIPLALGDNVITVESVDVLGNVNAEAARATLRDDGPVLLGAYDLVGEAESGRVYVLDHTRHGVVEIDLATGLRRDIASAGDETLPAISDALGFAVGGGSARGFLLAATKFPINGPPTLFEVDTVTGHRKLLSDSSHGVGPPLDGHGHPVFDERHQQVLAIHGSALNEIISIDAVSGNRSILSGPGHGGGVPFSSLSDLAVDHTRARLLALSIGSRAVIAVDLTNGDRTIVSNDQHGSGASLLIPIGIAFDDATGRIIVTDLGRSSVVAIEPSSGNRATLVHLRDWAGNSSSMFGPLLVQADGTSAFLLDSDAIEVVDLASGVHCSKWATARGTGPKVRYAGSFAHGNASRVLDFRSFSASESVVSPTVLRVDIISGDRAEFPDSSAENRWASDAGFARDLDGSHLWTESIDLGDGLKKLVEIDPGKPDLRVGATVGDSLDVVGDLALDPGWHRALVSFDRRLCEFDSASNGSVVSGVGVGSGTMFGLLRPIVVDRRHSRLLGIDSQLGALFAVDLWSGNRRIVADATHGSGPILDHILGLDLDEFEERAYAIDTVRQALVSIDLLTGDQAIVSTSLPWLPSAQVGTGPNFAEPRSLVVDAIRGVAFTVHGAPLNAILAVELTSGDRVLVSR